VVLDLMRRLMREPREASLAFAKFWLAEESAMMWSKGNDRDEDVDVEGQRRIEQKSKQALDHGEQGSVGSAGLQAQKGKAHGRSQLSLPRAWARVIVCLARLDPHPFYVLSLRTAPTVSIPTSPYLCRCVNHAIQEPDQECERVCKCVSNE
jgi:hypothetical protein